MMYLAATKTLRADSSVLYFAGDLTGTRDEYEAEQRSYMRSKEAIEFDETFSVIRVKNFREMLRRLEVDALALFGERDTNVDWRKARALYESAIGEQAEATLTVRTFPECNHS